MKPFAYRGKTVMVARNGNVYFKRKKLNQYDNGNGYKTFSLRSRLFYVQIVVCTVYHGKAPKLGMQANHKNGIRHDNRAVNLQWDTSSDNHKHAYAVLKRKHSRGQLNKSGILHHNSKAVEQINIVTGEVINTFYSVKEAARALGMKSSGGIHNCINKVGRTKYCYGFDWRYAEIKSKYKKKYIYYYVDGIKKRKLNDEI